MSVPAALLVSGCAGDTRRYRLFHQAEALMMAGWQIHTRVTDGAWDPRELPIGRVVVLHRVPWDDRVAELVDRARGRGAKVLFDTDDLVFRPERTSAIAGLQGWSAADRSAFAEMVARYRQTLLACDGALVPTRFLADEVEALGLPAAVCRNAVNLELLRLSTTAVAARRQNDDKIVVGYASGTPTHDRDFAVVSDCLRALMDADPGVRLRLLGYLTLDDSWRPYAERIEQLPFMPWRDLPVALAGLDINLAPLEIGDPFCESKSELKYFEAGAVGVPTIASATGAFSHAIRDGESGRLAAGPEEWSAALANLVEDSAHRRQLGRAARADVVARYVTDVRAPELAAAVAGLAGEPTSVRRPEQGRLRVAVLKPAERVTQDSGSPESEPSTLMGTLESGLGAAGGHVVCVVGPDPQYSEDDGTTATSPLDEFDVVVGTSPEVAQVVSQSGASEKVLLVDDYTPFHFPMSTSRVASQRSFGHGLDVVALGPWLVAWLAERHGTVATAVGYPTDLRVNYPAPHDPDGPLRVVYDAVGCTAAGGEDLGIRTLTLLREWVADVEVVLHGLPDGGWRPTFAYDDAGSPNEAGRAALYRSATAGLFPAFANLPPDVPAAMACGCAVVAVDTASVRWLLHDGMTAALGAPTAEALCAQLVRVLSSRDYRARLVAGAYAAVERMSRERTAGSLVTALAQLAAGASVDGPHAERELSAESGRPGGSPLHLDWLQPLADDEKLYLGGGVSVGQTFRSRFDGLYRVDVVLHRASGAPGDRVVLRLKADPAAEDDIAAATVQCNEIIDDEWTAFRFPPVPESAGRRFYARLECPGAEPGNGPAVALCRADVFAGGRAYRDDEVIARTLPFRTFCRPIVRPSDLTEIPSDQPDRLLQRLESLGVEVQAMQAALARDHAALPYRLLCRLVGAISRRD